MLVALWRLHVCEDVGGCLVERGHLARGAVGELHVGEVALGALDVLRGRHQVVTRDARHAVPLLQPARVDTARDILETI